ncbi:hypothetical protein [Pseudomonas sp. AN3A02]|uniref:hypothetical protein n=1 Tax=Pseudomonas sp. AN3A02 TaxID=2719587 RepID=UPI00142F4B52|nr:hypothetical protein [Pseudomonas sp. AN3A02]NIL19516.1 hypothetical protein [Pseudomonas sp. AN3A02]
MIKPKHNYTGKPTAYLDHNILNYFLRHPETSAFEKIFEEQQVVYSDETLREIKRSKGKENDFLNKLKKLNAMHFKIFVDENHQSTNDAIISDADPFEQYARLCEQLHIIDKIYTATNNTLRKFHGDKSLPSIEELDQQQSSDFIMILEELMQKKSNTDTLTSEQLTKLNNYISRTLQHQKTIQELSTKMMLNYQRDDNASMINTYRAKVGIGPLELNNVKGPKIIEKIWSLHKDLDGYKGRNFSIEDFLGINYIPSNLNGCIPTSSKIISAYNVLNVIGYFNDSDLKLNRRFTSATSDANHVALASFADTLYSSDIGMIKKGRAIYEFLDVRTKIITINVIDNRPL